MSKIISPIPRKQLKKCFFISRNNPKYFNEDISTKFIMEKTEDYKISKKNTQIFEIDRANNPIEFDNKFIQMNTKLFEISTGRRRRI